MSDKKISQLTASTTPLAGTEVLPVVQGGNTVKVSVDNLTAGKNVPALTYNSVTINRGLANQAASVAIVANALASTTSGINNTAVGAAALRYCTTGSYNVAVGTLCFSGANPMTGLFNTAVGASNAQKISSGSNNVGFGYATISNVATSSGNTGLGNVALNLVTGANNTGVGYKAGNTATTGSNNAFFGYDAQPSAITVSNEYTYGNSAVTKHRFVGGDIVIGTAGKGIDFSADPNAGGMTSELLDDYEEGTWTPTFIAATPFTDITYDPATSGTYVKVGKLVHVTFAIKTDAITGGAGSVKIGGLPFVNQAVTGEPEYGGVTIGWASAYSVNTPRSGIVDPGQSRLSLTYRATSVSGDAYLQVTDLRTTANSNETYASFTYHTT